MDSDDEKGAAGAAADGKVVVYDQLTMNSADIVFVNDRKTLAVAIETLKAADVIGVDLEHMVRDCKVPRRSFYAVR